MSAVVLIRKNRRPGSLRIAAGPALTRFKDPARTNRAGTIFLPQISSLTPYPLDIEPDPLSLEIRAIRGIVIDVAGPTAKTRVFGSRLRDEATGGDLDLLIELPHAVDAPAELAARLSAPLWSQGRCPTPDPKLATVTHPRYRFAGGAHIMTLPRATVQRLRFLVRVSGKESRYLTDTTERLFNAPFTPERVSALEADAELAERVDAFVSRFGRLQDTLGDKLLPLLLTALGEKVKAQIDNLDLAERLGLIPSADQWMEIRKLRDQMVHEYVEDPLVLANALESAHRYVPLLTSVARKITTEIEERVWA